MNRKTKIFSLIFVFALISLPLQWVYATGSVRVAFIDTGISTKHIDPVQVAEGKNYVFPARDTEDRNGHGTATSGMALGSSKLGLEGSCPDAVAVPLVTYDRYPSGVSQIGDVLVMCEAIYDAVDVFGCRVINISMGIPAESEELRLAVEYAEEKGVVVVSAVGNDNLLHPNRRYYPAIYDTVIGVGAADNSVDGYMAADFSLHNGVSVLAKGANVKTVTNRNEGVPTIRSGTSYACAYVSGLCAQLLIDSPSLTPAQVRALLYATAQDIGIPGVDIESGWGVVGINSPNSEPITRGMLAMLLYVYDGKPESETSSFVDVLPGSYYETAVAWAAENDIIHGCGNGKFEPDKIITREQMAAILYRYAQYKNYDVSLGKDTNFLSCNDIEKVSGYAILAMQWACDTGLIQGSYGNLMPQVNITKEQVATIFFRFSENVIP
ncbi:MAG: S8 family serine peptidase [Candidatus Alkaliphilus sp. MAG34]